MARNTGRAAFILEPGLQAHIAAQKHSAKKNCGQRRDVLLLFLYSWPSDFGAISSLEQLQGHYG